MAQALARDGLEDGMEKLQMSTLVSEYLKVQDLRVVPEKSMQLAVENFVDKGDRDAIAKLETDCATTFGAEDTDRRAPFPSVS